MEPACTKVFLVDDDPSVRRALCNLLESVSYQVEAYVSAEAFLNGAVLVEGGCLVLDLRLPGMDGLRLQQALADSTTGLSIVFITAHGDVTTGVRAMKQGAVNFLLKPFSDQSLLDAVAEAVARGETVRSEQQTRGEAEARIAMLSPREREVLALVVEGLRNKEIAARLGVTEQTIKVHRGKVMEKTGAQSLCELVRLVDRVKY